MYRRIRHASFLWLYEKVVEAEIKSQCILGLPDTQAGNVTYEQPTASEPEYVDVVPLFYVVVLVVHDDKLCRVLLLGEKG